MSANDLVFGKYAIQHRLAIGGMGEVFYAIQLGIPGFERPVILKSLLPDLAAQEGLVDQFLDEARVAATLNHPNVVSIYEVGLWNGTYFIAMEYIRGRNLAQLIRKALDAGVEIPPWVAARVIADAAAGLHHAHVATDGQGKPLHIVHRDISPQNIMLRDDGVTKVVDFGIARAANRSTRTATGTLKGKLAYMAPEQILSEPLTPQADQFALGVCFWELLSGRRLFKADQELKVLEKVLNEPIRPPSEHRANGPSGYDDIAMKMLERTPNRRFASCAEAAAAIEQRLAQSAAESESPAGFMRQLGTDDLVINVRRTGSDSKNFVISLGAQATPAGAKEVAPGVATKTLGEGPPASVAAPLPARRKGPVLAAVGALALALVLAGAWTMTRPTPAIEAPPAEPASVVVAPTPAVVAPGTPTPEPAQAPPAMVRFSVVSNPPKASVRFDGRPLGETPLVVEATPGETHYLQAEHAGHQRLEVEVRGAPGEARTVELELQKLKRADVRPGSTAPATSKDPGYLSLDTRPWSKVTIDAEYAGSTPLFKRKLAAGKHRLQLVNEGEGVSVTRDIVIAPGETLKLNLPLK